MTTRSWAELQSSGLLWLINASVFHPRGLALAFVTDDDGEPRGWVLLGDGSELWWFNGGDPGVIDLFLKAQQTLAQPGDSS